MKTERLVANLKAKCVAINSNKCQLHSFDKIGNNSAKLYLKSTMEFNVNDAREFIFSKFNNKLLPFNQSFNIEKTPDHYYTASIIAYRTPIAMIELDKAGARYTKISANTFLDQELKTVWTKENINQVDYLIRENDGDVYDLLTSVNLQASTSLRMSASVNRFLPEDNTFVEFFALTEDGPGIGVGKLISAVDTDEETFYTINTYTKENGTVTIPASACIRAVEINAGVSNVEEALDILRKCYGDSYANKLKEKM